MAEEADYAEGHRFMLNMVRYIRAEGWDCSGFLIQGEVVKDVLLDKIRALNADLVVVGSSEKGWPSRKFSGSTSSELLSLDVPVLVLKASIT